MSQHNLEVPKPFRFRNLQLDVPVVLAPMVGLTHSALRCLLLELGGVGMFYTEMLAASHLPHESDRSSPMLVRREDERPLNYQIYISDPGIGPKAVERLESFGADAIDINLGCPAPQVRRRGAGGYLAEDREVVAKIICTIRKATNLPLSVKIRIGRNLDRERLSELVRMLECEGVDMVAVHARLHGEKFCRPPRWEWVRVVKEAVTIPVIANGGIFSVEDARKCLEVSGADGLMIGRGGMENPFLFRQVAKALYSFPEIHDNFTAEQLYGRFIELLVERFPQERRLGRLKQFTHYFARAYQFGHRLATQVQKCRDMQEAQDVAAGFISRNRPDRFYES